MLTPLESKPDLAKTLGIDAIYFKREDLHPYHSHKGRSIPVMIDLYRKNGDTSFAISSSGNAALAAAMHIHGLNNIAKDGIKYNLEIYIGRNIASTKLKSLESYQSDNIKIIHKERPLQALIESTQRGLRSLRQSTDNNALIGYEKLADEICKEFNTGSIFIGSSSGTTAESLAEYFLKHNLPFQVHIVQTSSCHPLSDAFTDFDLPQEKSIADAIVDQTAHRKASLIPLIKSTGGTGWCATNEQIRSAVVMTEKYASLKVSNNSALSIAGAMQAIYTSYDLNQPVICIISGN